jgi:3-oxoacyl-[acyl-carrier protein] reductase
MGCWIFAKPRQRLSPGQKRAKADDDAGRRLGAVYQLDRRTGALGTPLTYGTAKAAMNHMAKELARITGASGVRVNVIAPGNIVFPDGDWEARANGPTGDKVMRWIKREVPMRRFGYPEEIGSAAAFLMSNKASFITGAVLPVDGGQTR